MLIHHTPVFLKRILNEFIREADNFIVDATIGEGGHAEAFLQRGRNVIGIDRDEEIIKKCKARLEKFGRKLKTYSFNFKESEAFFESIRFQYDFVLFDLGISLFHYRESKKGFSFLINEKLDMRLDNNLKISAWDVVNTFSEKEIADIFYRFGEEKRSRIIAEKILELRSQKPINTTYDLADAVQIVYPGKYRINPSTKVFQALRIYVNDELSAVEAGVKSALKYIKKNGRVCVIAYHSLEDRIIKNMFKNHCAAKKNINKYKDILEPEYFKILTKKPIIPSEDEIENNTSARSAKMRIIEKVN